MMVEIEDRRAPLAEIQALIDRWAAAVRSHDLEGVLRHHASDMVMFDVVGPLRIEGLEGYAATWREAFFAWHGSEGRFDLRDLHIEAGDRVAFAHGLIDCAGTENGQRVAFVLRLTICLVRDGGQWTVVHEHHSEPLPFDAATIGEGSA